VDQGAPGEGSAFLQTEQSGTGPRQCRSGLGVDRLAVADHDAQAVARSPGHPYLCLGTIGVLADVGERLLRDAIGIPSERSREGLGVLDPQLEVDLRAGLWGLLDEARISEASAAGRAALSPDPAPRGVSRSHRAVP